MVGGNLAPSYITPNNGSYSALGIFSGARVPPSIKRYPIQPVHKPSTAPI